MLPRSFEKSAHVLARSTSGIAANAHKAPRDRSSRAKTATPRGAGSIGTSAVELAHALVATASPDAAATVCGASTIAVSVAPIIAASLSSAMSVSGSSVCSSQT